MEPLADEFELLRRYAQQRDEGAFAKVVRQYVNVVYSSAMRRVGNRSLAEDVTQATFIILARKSNSLCGGRKGPLGAWLLATVRFTAANAIKMESRRTMHEQAAMTSVSEAASANPTEVLIWQEISQQVDDAVLGLSSIDRRVVLMRYFEDRQIGEIATALSISEGAARQRLSRALSTLRDRLAKKEPLVGTIDGAALGDIFASRLIRAAPPGVVHAACLAGTGAGTTTGISIAKGAIKMMSMAKTKLAAAVLAVATIGGVGGVMAIRSAPAAQDQQLPPPAQRAAADDADNQITLAAAPPVVVKTEPESGTDGVDSSITEIRVTYSKDMKDKSWSWSTWGENTFPKMTGKPHYEDNKRTCVAPVKLEPNKVYAIWLNSENFGNFRDSSGKSAVPYLLIFKTKP
jgi:RNA polymerase sigma factor (sigma-70 family)